MNVKIMALMSLMVSLSAGFAQEYGQIDSYERISDYNGQQWKQVVIFARLASTPKWDPDKQECPLSLPKAISAARSLLQKHFPNVTKFSAVDIAIKNPVPEQYWIYDICFEPKGEAKPFNGEIRILVLLDGTVPDFTKVERRSVKGSVP